MVAVSDDEGASFRPLLRYTDLCGPLECAKVACARPFEILANTLQIVPPAACSESPAPVDAAVPMPMVDAAIARDMAAPMQGATGCGCGVASRAPRRSGAASLLLVFVVALRDRRMKRRREAR